MYVCVWSLNLCTLCTKYVGSGVEARQHPCADLQLASIFAPAEPETETDCSMRRMYDTLRIQHVSGYLYDTTNHLYASIHKYLHTVQYYYYYYYNTRSPFLLDPHSHT